MQPQEIEGLIRELMQAFQLLVDSGEALSDEFYGMAAQTLDTLVSRLDQEEEPPEVPPEPLGEPSPDAQLLWVLAGGQEQAFISYLRDFPSPQTQSLLNNPLELSRIIDWLDQNIPQGVRPIVDGIQQADLNSSNIWGTQYDEKSGKMKVRFQSGAEYEYDGVPANIYRAFSHGNAAARTNGRNEHGRWWVGKNPSLGAAMNQYIKAGNFPYRRIR